MSKRKRTGRVHYSDKIKKLIRDNKGLPKYAWPGGYPIFYYVQEPSYRGGLSDELNPVCHECARSGKHLGSDDVVTEYEVNWEDPDLYCEGCDKRIESAYADKD
jgi:hypothetical protein